MNTHDISGTLIWRTILTRITYPQAAILLTIILLLAEIPTLTGQRITRDANVDLLVNHAGYLPNASKTVVARSTTEGNFQVILATSNKVVLSGSFQPAVGDFGAFSTGDFSQVSEKGVYYIQSDTLRSVPFKISPIVYKPAMNSILGYFSRQRCGGSTTGYLTPCHLDDGVRMDNGKHQDVSGGWHDASDLRKWVGATIYGMIGIAKTYQIYQGIEREILLSELRWGNRYFLSMQEPQGYIMSYVGGDVLRHSDSNRWTDNTNGEEEGELGFIKPNAGQSTADMLIIGSKDDRVIKTEPLGFVGQYNFITAQALMADITMEQDPSYSAQCLEAAKRCFSWCANEDKTWNPGMIGASIQAAIELYKTTKDETFLDFAVDQASQLQKLQEVRKKNEISGFYYLSASRDEPYKNVWNGCMEFYALADLVEVSPDHKEAGTWKEMISLYARNYFRSIMRRNNFGIVPFGLYQNEDPGGNRAAGQYWYRYFMQPELDWWVGVNSNLASAGIGLWKAAKVLNDPELKAYAQKQIDWILGVNPFNSSTLIGIGYNHPKHFPGSTFHPQVPVIQGAVMNGLGGDHLDQPDQGKGGWQISEYWTPMVAHTLWLMAEISAVP